MRVPIEQLQAPHVILKAIDDYVQKYKKAYKSGFSMFISGPSKEVKDLETLLKKYNGALTQLEAIELLYEIGTLVNETLLLLTDNKRKSQVFFQQIYDNWGKTCHWDCLIATTIGCSDIALAIEGGNLHGDSHQVTKQPINYPDVTLAAHLASSKGLVMFDPIHSYSQHHMTTYYKNILKQCGSYQAQEAALRNIFFNTFALKELQEGNVMAELLDVYIKAPLLNLLQDAEMAPIIKQFVGDYPNMLHQDRNLSAQVLEQFFNRLILDYEGATITLFDGDVVDQDEIARLATFHSYGPGLTRDQMCDHLRVFENDLLALSNELSSEVLLGQAEKMGEQINKIYCLVGKAHLMMLDTKGQVRPDSDNVLAPGFHRIGEYKKLKRDNDKPAMRHVDIALKNGKNVGVFLFGSIHGNVETARMMMSHIRQHQLADHAPSAAARP